MGLQRADDEPVGPSGAKNLGMQFFRIFVRGLCFGINCRKRPGSFYFNLRSSSPLCDYFAMEHVEILFKEYDTLRTEIIVRNNSVGHLLAIVAAGLTWGVTWMASHPPVNWQIGACLAVLLLLMILYFRALYVEISNQAAKLVDLELAINEIAGKTLLTWESTRKGRGRLIMPRRDPEKPPKEAS